MDGSEKGFNTVDNAAKSPMLWAARSTNTVPVAERHEIIQSAASQRLLVAQSRLDALYTNQIELTLRSLTRTISEKLETNMWSMEGDELHQFIDCVVLGPYASADLFSSFDVSGGGGKFQVPRYHRGDERSRHFMKDPSEARQRIIESLMAYVHDRTDNITRTAAVNCINLIQNKFLDQKNFYCECPASDEPSLECCARPDWSSIAALARGTDTARRLVHDSD